MSIFNYLSKIRVVFNHTRGVSFFHFLVNSKRYSSLYKSGRLDSSRKDEVVYKVLFKDNKSDVALRTYKGDIDIFYEVFWKNNYKIKNILQPKVIIDLGAHIGLASLFYASEYADAKVFSVEASKDNYRLLEFNSKKFANITPINAAINFCDGDVKFKVDDLAYNFKIDDEGEIIKGISVDTLMNQFGLSKIDLLKIDIEGAERQLLSINNSWLNLVDNIIIELHNPYTLDDLLADVTPFGFKCQEGKTGNKSNDVYFLYK